MGTPDPVNLAEDAWRDLLARYRIGTVRGEQIVQGTLHPHLDPDDPEVVRALEGWAGRSYLAQAQQGTDVVLVRSTTRDRPGWLLHAVLFALTLFTTHMAGALLAGVDPMDTRFVQVAGFWIPLPTGVNWSEMAMGASFALPLMGVLLAHEMGHYLAALRHRVRATLPFFIPFPAYYSVVGTLGAFIRIKSPTVRRPILFDVGVAGPLASFALSVPVLFVGLTLSTPVVGSPEILTPFVVRFAGEPILIGTGPISGGLAALALPGTFGEMPVLLHPVAFAGWLGLFVTALNLLPFGQLDGGHVLYALAPGWQAAAGRLFLAALLPLGLLWWGWWLWGAAALLLSRRRVAHPPVLQEMVGLGRRRRILAWVAIVIFFLSFCPVPVRLGF